MSGDELHGAGSPAITSHAHWRPSECADAIPTDAVLPFAPVLSRGTLSLNLYAPRREDRQTEHMQDEVYFIARGQGRLAIGSENYAFGPGDALFVPARTAHRFESFSDDLLIWVVLFGPVGGEGDA